MLNMRKKEKREIKRNCVFAVITKPGEPYPTIAINDAGNPERMIEFYVTGKQYDVYHVAFKGFTKG